MSNLEFRNPKQNYFRTTRAYRLAPESGNIGINLHTSGIDACNIYLGKATTAIKKKVTRTLARIGIDLLTKAVPLTPIDPDPAVGGQLRESGRATINFIGGETFLDIAWGKKEGHVTANPSRLESRNYKSITEARMNVSFARLSDDKREDVALWAHEDLMPFGATGHPRARTPGTGPKYLEKPWLANKDTYMSMIKTSLSNRQVAAYIKGIGSVQKGKGKYDIDRLKIRG